MGRYPTPTGEPCPRTVHLDGHVDGTGACTSCGCCLLIAEAAFPGAERDSTRHLSGSSGAAPTGFEPVSPP